MAHSDGIDEEEDGDYSSDESDDEFSECMDENSPLYNNSYFDGKN